MRISAERGGFNVPARSPGLDQSFAPPPSPPRIIRRSGMKGKKGTCVARIPMGRQSIPDLATADRSFDRTTFSFGPWRDKKWGRKRMHVECMNIRRDRGARYPSYVRNKSTAIVMAFYGVRFFENLFLLTIYRYAYYVRHFQEREEISLSNTTHLRIIIFVCKKYYLRLCVRVSMRLV